MRCSADAMQTFYPFIGTTSLPLGSSYDVCCNGETFGWVPDGPRGTLRLRPPVRHVAHSGTGARLGEKRIAASGQGEVSIRREHGEDATPAPHNTPFHNCRLYRKDRPCQESLCEFSGDSPGRDLRRGRGRRDATMEKAGGLISHRPFPMCPMEVLPRRITIRATLSVTDLDIVDRPPPVVAGVEQTDGHDHVLCPGGLVDQNGHRFVRRIGFEVRAALIGFP